MDKLIIGSHVSFKSNNQLVGSVMEAISYGANTFMFYTGAPQNTVRVPINDDYTYKAYELMKENGIDPYNVIVHAPYIVNLGNDQKNYDFAINFLKEEIDRVIYLGFKKIVLHPGSHVSLGTENGLKNIVFALNQVLKNKDIIILLETMAGKGTEVGINFDELKYIIDNVNEKEKIGVCMDTCHLNDAGYDLNDFDKILDEFDKKIGLNKLMCIHINDSKNIINSHKDRHENIGIGTIGFDNLIKIIYHEKLKDVPKILETPYVGEYPPYKYEIEMIKNKKFDNNLIDNITNQK